jgi:SAM-dependent methyltransferase
MDDSRTVPSVLDEVIEPQRGFLAVHVNLWAFPTAIIRGAMRSTSNISTVGVRHKWGEALTFLAWRLSEGPDLEYIDSPFYRLERDVATFAEFTGRDIASARVLEIGYGARPFHMMALMSMGVDVRGIDLDRPTLLRFSPIVLMKILKSNGFERALKTAARSLLFDRRDRIKLTRVLKNRGYQLRVDRSRFLVGDATTYDFGPEPFDLIYSHDVFEHVPAESLPRLIENLAARLSPGGVVVIVPNVFTGITGGHLPEWYLGLVDQDIPRSSEPWEHLRKCRYQANTYLNRLSRADYRDLFNTRFEIVREQPLIPGHGHQWLTPEVRAELAQWSDDELFSNTVEFVLRRRSRSSH